MVSRLFGKLEAQRQRTSGMDCAMAGAETAPAATPAPMPVRNFLRLVVMVEPLLLGKNGELAHPKPERPSNAMTPGRAPSAGRGIAALLEWDAPFLAAIPHP